MNFVKSVQKKIFSKSKGKLPTSPSTTGSSSTSFSFESEILKKDFAGIETLPKPELVDLLQKCIAEYNSYISLSKEFIKNGEEAIERCQQQDLEYEALKEQYTNLTAQTGAEPVAFPDEKTKKLEGEVSNLHQIILSNKKTIERLEETIKQRDKIIVEYDEKFDMMEERTQDALGKSEKVPDARLVGLQKEIEMLRKENEELLLNKQKETNALTQERTNHHKSLMILEKNVSCLLSEKVALENKLKSEKCKIEHTNKRYISREAQTENKSFLANEESSPQLIKREQEIDNIRRYANSVKNDRDQTLEKLSEANKKVEKLSTLLEERIAEVQKLQQDNSVLKFENVDLKKRREASAAEVTKLAKQLKKRGVISEEDKSNFRQKKRVDPKIPRHISEAVISLKESQEGKGMTGEQELLLTIRKELELIYKDFIRCVFHDPKEDKSEIDKLAGMVDIKLNSVIEKVADYCEDRLEPTKEAFLVAKLKKEESKTTSKAVKETAKVTTAVMPSVPGQTFMKRIEAQLQDKNAIPFVDEVINSPLKNSFHETGPFKAVPKAQMRIINGMIKFN